MFHVFKVRFNVMNNFLKKLENKQGVSLRQSLQLPTATSMPLCPVCHATSSSSGLSSGNSVTYDTNNSSCLGLCYALWQQASTPGMSITVYSNYVPEYYSYVLRTRVTWSASHSHHALFLHVMQCRCREGIGRRRVVTLGTGRKAMEEAGQ